MKWFTYSENEKTPAELMKNEMSVYDLKKHSKFVFRPGSIVKSKPAQDDKMGKVIDSCVEVSIAIDVLLNFISVYFFILYNSVFILNRVELGWVELS